MSEKHEASLDGGKLQKNSGRGKIQKGDATRGSFLYDIKEYARSFSVSVDNWAKLQNDAFNSSNKIPAFKIVLGRGNKKLRLWVFSDTVAQEMMDMWEDKYG